MQMAMMNRSMYDALETVFMVPSETYSYVSSRLVRLARSRRCATIPTMVRLRPILRANSAFCLAVGSALAFAAVYFIWGSTYLAIRFAIETMPPLAASPPVPTPPSPPTAAGVYRARRPSCSRWSSCSSP